MSAFLSRLHKEVRRALHTRRGSDPAQHDYPEGTHKSYPRMEHIPLPAPEPTGYSLEQALGTRRSRRSTEPGEALSRAECGTLFGHGLSRRPDSLNRNYPSGGRLFPVETYLITRGIEQAGAGIYHYDPSQHALEKLWDLPSDLDFKSLIPKPPGMHFSSVVVFTALWRRSSVKYGDLAYSHALIEAGHMSQNMLLLSETLGINACPMAGFNDALITELLDLDDRLEQPVHTIALSKTDPLGSVSPRDVQ